MLNALTYDKIDAHYERMLIDVQNYHAQVLAVLEASHLERYEAVVDVLYAMVQLFDGMDIRDMLTLSEQQRQHVALVLHEARRCLAEAREERKPRHDILSTSSDLSRLDFRG